MLEDHRIIRRHDVEALVGFRRSQIYALIAKDEFPRPVQLSKRAVGWRSAHIEAWLASRQPRKS